MKNSKEEKISLLAFKKTFSLQSGTTYMQIAIEAKTLENLYDGQWIGRSRNIGNFFVFELFKDFVLYFMGRPP